MKEAIVGVGESTRGEEEEREMTGRLPSAAGKTPSAEIADEGRSYP